LLLADEPTGNLDSATSDAIHDLFFQIAEEHGTTVVVVTHNPAFADRMPRVVQMRDGKIVSDAPGARARPLAEAAAPPALAT
jgi:lipoprotein-releasing system ATP-binding protein